MPLPWGFAFPKEYVLITIVLVCAVLASLAAGVLVAYMICHLMFSLFHSHARQIALSSGRAPAVRSQVSEG
jgi:MFS superfamily sulfate permease-like transporter